MAVKVTLFVHGTIVGVDGVTIPFGSETVPSVLTPGTGTPYRKTVEVAQNTTKTIFDATNDIGDFEFAIITSDQDVIIEETVDQNAGVGTEVLTKKLRADFPYILSHNVGYANYTINFGGGTLDVIDRIRVRNLGATTANVTILAVT